MAPRPPIQAVIEEQAELDPMRRHWKMALFTPEGVALDLAQVAGVGPTGPTGPTGATGATGPEGLSAYDIWLAQPGNAGKTVNEYLASLVGPTGPTGPTGATGPYGHIELGYAKKNDTNLAMTTGSSWLTVGGLSIPVTEGDRPYVVRASGTITSNTLNRYGFLTVSEVAGGVTTQLDIAQNYTSGLANTGDRVVAEWREQNPVPGRVRTFVVQIGSGGVELTTLVTSPTVIAFIQALTV